jgi:hypothetical protein
LRTVDLKTENPETPLWTVAFDAFDIAFLETSCGPMPFAIARIAVRR